jgi:hypothetical protein
MNDDAVPPEIEVLATARRALSDALFALDDLERCLKCVARDRDRALAEVATLRAALTRAGT